MKQNKKAKRTETNEAKHKNSKEIKNKKRNVKTKKVQKQNTTKKMSKKKQQKKNKKNVTKQQNLSKKAHQQKRGNQKDYGNSCHIGATFDKHVCGGHPQFRHHFVVKSALCKQSISTFLFQVHLLGGGCGRVLQNHLGTSGVAIAPRTIFGRRQI